jgi:hypothetical protein
LIPLILFAHEYFIGKTPLQSFPKLKWAFLFCIPLLYIPIQAILADSYSQIDSSTGFSLYPFWQHLGTQLYFQTFYLVLFLNPHLQSIIHQNPSYDWLFYIGAGTGAAIWIGSFIYIIKNYRRSPRACFLIFLFFISYLPSNSFLQMINPFAEYRLYFSNLLLCILLGYGILEGIKRSSKTVQAAIPLSILMLLGFFTFQQVSIWKTWEGIFTQMITRYPTLYREGAKMILQMDPSPPIVTSPVIQDRYQEMVEKKSLALGLSIQNTDQQNQARLQLFRDQ